VLVVDASLVPALGYFGEVLATGAQARGLAGLVIDGCVRDIGALERLSFPVFARGAALTGTSKIGGGAIGGPTWVGGVEVRAGDWIVGDVDGAVRVPSAAVDSVIAAGRAREAKERSMLDALRAGSTTIDLLGLDLTPLSATDNSAGSVTGVISTAGAPVPSGGYNQARWAGDFCYLAGVGPYDPVTRAIVGDDIATQTAQALANCAVTLAAAGLNWSNVISTSVFLADLDRDWRTFDEVYSMTLPRPYPTRAMVGAALKNILVELVMVAHAAP
jgi:enamine deaminase RidA (YjgF/YER057c/UK114 family)